MSSSYSALNQKYNTLLALVLEGGTGGGGSETLQQVLTNGDTATIPAIFDDSTTKTTISPTGIAYENTTGVGINTTLGDFVEVSSTTPSKSSKMTNEDVVINDSVDNSLMTISSNNINCIKNTTNTIDLGIDIQPELLLVSTGGTTSITDLAMKSAKLDAYTAGALGIGESTATVINVGRSGVTLANKGLLTSVTGIQTDSIDALTSGALSLGGTLATSIALNEPVTASSTLGVTGILTATGGIKSNSLNSISGNIVNLGTDAGNNTINIGIAGGNINVKGNLYSNSLDSLGGVNTTLTIAGANATNTVSIGNSFTTFSNLSKIFKLYIADGNGSGTAGQVLTSGGAGTCSWTTVSSGGTTILSGETVVGAMTSAVTGTVTYSSAFATKPKIQLTFNLNGTGTTIIPVAVLSHTISTNYTGFTWIAGSTSSTATISWYATI